MWFANAGLARGIGRRRPTQDWDRQWNVNVMSHVHAARALLPGWIERGKGHLVTTASMAGILTSLGDGAYAATKHAAVGFAEWLAITYADDGVQRVVHLPGRGRHGDAAGRGRRRRGQGQRGDRRGRGAPPERAAERILEAVAEDRFLILTHPEMHEFAVGKASEPERWIRGMSRLWARAQALLGRKKRRQPVCGHARPARPRDIRIAALRTASLQIAALAALATGCLLGPLSSRCPSRRGGLRPRRSPRLPAACPQARSTCCSKKPETGASFTVLDLELQRGAQRLGGQRAGEVELPGRRGLSARLRLPHHARHLHDRGGRRTPATSRRRSRLRRRGLYGAPLANALPFYENERDGPEYIPSALRTAPAHLNDEHARTYVTPHVNGKANSRANSPASARRSMRQAAGGMPATT